MGQKKVDIAENTVKSHESQEWLKKKKNEQDNEKRIKS